MLVNIKKRLSIPASLWITYLIFYFVWGTCMNQIGKWLEIAQFTYWWQVITCYCLYMVPMSILMRDKTFFVQYVYGVVAIAPMEFLGYMNHTSIAIHLIEDGNTIINEGNILAQYVNIKNFSLAMAMFFGIYFPLGNKMVEAIYRLFGRFNLVKSGNIKDKTSHPS